MDLKAQFEAYKNEGGSFRKLASLLGYNNHTYVTLAINGWGKFELSSQAKKAVEEKIEAFFNSKQAKNGSRYHEICEKAGILPFTNTLNIFKSIGKAIRQRALMKITARSGTGKTTALKAMQKTYPQMAIVTAYDGMSKRELLEKICLILNAKSVSKTQKDLMDAIKAHLSNDEKVLVIDEANFMCEKSLEQIRHIHDECGVAIILAGTEALDYQIASSHEQVASRIKNAKEVTPFGEYEIIWLFEKNGFVIDEKQAKRALEVCKNLRVVGYVIDDINEEHNGNIEKLEEVLREYKDNSSKKAR